MDEVAWYCRAYMKSVWIMTNTNVTIWLAQTHTHTKTHITDTHTPIHKHTPLHALLRWMSFKAQLYIISILKWQQTKNMIMQEMDFFGATNDNYFLLSINLPIIFSVHRLVYRKSANNETSITMSPRAQGEVSKCFCFVRPIVQSAKIFGFLS